MRRGRRQPFEHEKDQKIAGEDEMVYIEGLDEREAVLSLRINPHNIKKGEYYIFYRANFKDDATQKHF
jgi:hypothetical protein